MSEILYIRLASKPEQAIAWLVWSTGQQEIIASGELPDAQALATISDKARQRQVIAIAPGSDVLLKALTVPAKSAKAMRQAVPYMLEDELAQDVDELFFAFAERAPADSEHNCHVAIIERQLIQRWQAQLSDAGITCRVMMPETLLMPLIADKWSVIAHQGQLVVRQGAWQGASLDESQWQFMTQHWQQLDPMPSFVNYSPIPSLPVSIECEEAPAELPLALFAAQQQRDINLLQGDFAVKTKRSPAIKYWAVAASLAAFTLLLQLGVKGSHWYQLNQSTEQLEQEIIATYKQAFPNTKRVRIATIRSQLKRKIAEASGSASEGDFLPMLAKLESAFASVPELQTSSLRYDGKRNELRLQAEANSYQAFDKFKSALEKSRLAVTQGAQNNQGNRVTGSFSIKES
ncbi:type II secretion system protein GspL [Thalassotalea euphylliae]|uniref:Type II secretion system protein L n=1 Tax=Thalassotalea euphylliae TaxID=1655234 RepID=A0A3E0UJ27_9GAMM|nr:type II secretion system protein GspL [Thalassotalea euphylliae]REL36951.1 type II secretion system protein GspL [Thalassotalea euphylliae]